MTLFGYGAVSSVEGWSSMKALIAFDEAGDSDGKLLDPEQPAKYAVTTKAAAESRRP
jgi:hypothetical protein